MIDINRIDEMRDLRDINHMFDDGDDVNAYRRLDYIKRRDEWVMDYAYCLIPSLLQEQAS